MSFRIVIERDVSSGDWTVVKKERREEGRERSRHDFSVLYHNASLEMCRVYARGLRPDWERNEGR